MSNLAPHTPTVEYVVEPTWSSWVVWCADCDRRIGNPRGYFDELQARERAAAHTAMNGTFD